jgi:hypothetical protein
MGVCGLEATGSGLGQLAGICEHRNEFSVSIKGRIFLDYLSDSWFLKKDSAP